MNIIEKARPLVKDAVRLYRSESQTEGFNEIVGLLHLGHRLQHWDIGIGREDLRTLIEEELKNE